MRYLLQIGYVHITSLLIADCHATAPALGVMAIGIGQDDAGDERRVLPDLVQQPVGPRARAFRERFAYLRGAGDWWQKASPTHACGIWPNYYCG